MQFLTEVADAHRLAVVYENTLFGSSVARAALEQAPRAGVEIVAYEAYDQGGTDFTALLTRVKSTSPDAVHYVSYLADATLLMRQSKEIDLNPKVFTAGGAGFSLPDFLKGAGDTAEYTVSVTQWTPDAKWTGSREWAEQFRARTGYEPSYHSVLLLLSLILIAAPFIFQTRYIQHVLILGSLLPIALVVGWICFRLRGLYFTLATIAVGEVVRLVH